VFQTGAVGCADTVGRQMGGAKRHRYGEAGARAHLAVDADGTAMQFHQLLHQREADARAFEGAAFLALHPVEAFE